MVKKKKKKPQSIIWLEVIKKFGPGSELVSPI